MSKKFVLCLFCSLSCVIMACSDDDKSDKSTCSEDGSDNYCDSDTGALMICADGEFKQNNCGAGKRCELRNGRAQCVDVSNSPTSCGNITENGSCESDGRTLVYCANGVLQREVCDVKCVAADGVFHQCYEKCSPDLEELGNTGMCGQNNASYTYCDSQAGTVTVYCGSGEVCGKDENGFNRCISPSKGCGGITSAGVCEGKTLKFCNNDKIETQYCTERCVVIDEGSHVSFAQCYAPCGNVTHTGVCSEDGRNTKVCDPDYGLVVKKCAEDEECALVDGKPVCKTKIDVPALDCSTNEGKNGKCVNGNVLAYCTANGKVETQKCAHAKGCGVSLEGFASCYEDCGNVSGSMCSSDGKFLLNCDPNIGLTKFSCDADKACSTEDGVAACRPL